MSAAAHVGPLATELQRRAQHWQISLTSNGFLEKKEEEGMEKRTTTEERRAVLSSSLFFLLLAARQKEGQRAEKGRTVFRDQLQN